MTGLRLPRTIRLDPSDAFVFDRPAEPGEWAVTGSFLFLDRDLTSLTGKERIALRSGFVGVDSFGFSTLVVVSEASADELEAATAALARHLRGLGAPDEATARAAAGEELSFAASLCSHPVNTVLAMHRTAVDGEIREQFRTLRPREPSLAGGDRLHADLRVFQFVETDEEPEEAVDLTTLGREANR